VGATVIVGVGIGGNVGEGVGVGVTAAFSVVKFPSLPYDVPALFSAAIR